MSGKAGRGRFVIVDDDDLDWLSHSHWLYRSQTPHRNRHGSAGARTLIYAHPQTILARAILERHGHDLAGLFVRLSNGSWLDHRKANLRVGTRADNSRTLLRPDIHRTERQIGWLARGEVYSTAREAVAANDGKRVTRKMQKCWRVRLGRRLLGYFDTLEAAQAAHEQAACDAGFLTLGEEACLQAELISDLDSLVAAGRLTHCNAAAIEDRYKLFKQFSAI